jgi:hypothetical protein
MGEGIKGLVRGDMEIHHGVFECIDEKRHI